MQGEEPNTCSTTLLLSLLTQTPTQHHATRDQQLASEEQVT